MNCDYTYYYYLSKVKQASIFSVLQVESLVLVPGRKQQCPLATLAAGEAVYLLDPLEEEPRMLHSVYDHPVTCLDASDANVAFGVKRTGWAMHDGGNKVGSVSLSHFYGILSFLCVFNQSLLVFRKLQCH